MKHARPFNRFSSFSLHTMFVVSAGMLALLLGLWGYGRFQPHAAPEPRPRAMLLAPMIGVIEPCIALGGPAALPAFAHDLAPACLGEQGSAAGLIEATLAGLESSAAARGGAGGAPRLGYTLPVPLLQLLRHNGNTWEIDTALAQRFARTIQESPRAMVLYLFSTHFSADTPAEKWLAEDAKNLAHTQDGPLPVGTYYGAPVYNWTIATTRNTLTDLRLRAAQAILEEVCRLPATDREKIQGVTLLGETHHLFPDFEQGMGFGLPYRASDYSPESVLGFRRYLQQLFPTIAQLNRALGSAFPSYEAVLPPSKNIRSEPLQYFFEHMDGFAHGFLPISGWADPGTGNPRGRAAKVHIYLNGKLHAQTSVSQRRQDVLEAHPHLGTTDTGWRHDLDFRRLAPGIHRIDILLEAGPGPLVLLDTRRIVRMDAAQRTPLEQPASPLPAHQPKGATLLAHVDEPQDLRAYYFNPLAPLWLSFREQQVQDYLSFFARAVQKTCLGDRPLYSHQIYPYANPSWDHNKFAVGKSLQPDALFAPGISLYGDAAYGSSFLKWKQNAQIRRYGITEFHPLRAMSSTDIGEVLQRHEANGARFLSFFMEPRWNGKLLPRGHNMFSFDPDNVQFGSDALYQALQDHLAATATTPVSKTAKLPHR